MKKLITFLTTSLMIGLTLQAATFDDKTNLDQLTFKTLASGQIAWNEEDGAAVIYIGSPSESKNLRVIDPTAIRGYRYKQISSELTLNGSDNMTMMTNGTYKYTCGLDTSVTNYDYNLITEQETVTTNSAGQVTKYYCKYNSSTKTYYHIDLEPGYVIKPEVETIYWRMAYKLAKVQIFSKDSNIEDLDYTYTERQSSAGDDRCEIETIRTITYDGRKATLDIKVTAGRTNDWFQVTGFTARCRGIGDQEMVNDLTGDLTVMINDRLGTYNLNDLRYELVHKYDGNRGQHWSNYDAISDVHLRENYLTFNSTNFNRKSVIGQNYSSFMISHNDINFLKFTAHSAPTNNPYGDLECQIVAITAPTNQSNKVWQFDFLTSKAIPKNLIVIEYKADITDEFWTQIETNMSNPSGDQMTWHVEVPDTYGQYTKGFWRVGFNITIGESKLDLKATVRLMGSDGKWYKLSFPTGGGTVTAVLDDDDE